MNASLVTSTPRATIAALVLCLGLPCAAHAVPIASLEYVETALGGGQFRYEYTLSNLGDPVTDAGYDIFDLFLEFPLLTLVSATVPTGWDLFSGPGFLDTLSTFPLTPPDGTDIGPGQSLGGFVFVFDGPAASLPFQVYFVNPSDFENPILFDGVATRAATVPEPGASLLLTAALGLLALPLRRRRRFVG